MGTFSKLSSSEGVAKAYQGAKHSIFFRNSVFELALGPMKPVS